MIIKKKLATQIAPPADAEITPSSPPGVNEIAADHLPPPIDWSEETVEAGLAPERRTGDRRNDRRRGYRRIEDKGLISKAFEESNAIRENAYNDGFEEGLRQAREAIDTLRHQMASILNGREEALKSVAGEIGALAVEVAARIIKTEVSCDETLVMGLVEDIIQKAGRNHKSILLKLNPDDAPLVKRTLRESPIPNLHAELIIMDDPAVDLGSCIIETNSGMIDASFSTQLGILRQLFGSKAPQDTE